MEKSKPQERHRWTETPLSRAIKRASTRGTDTRLFKDDKGSRLTITSKSGDHRHYVDPYIILETNSAQSHERVFSSDRGGRQALRDHLNDFGHPPLRFLGSKVRSVAKHRVPKL
jgi:hypothetical protein